MRHFFEVDEWFLCCQAPHLPLEEGKGQSPTTYVGYFGWGMHYQKCTFASPLRA